MSKRWSVSSILLLVLIAASMLVWKARIRAHSAISPHVATMIEDYRIVAGEGADAVIRGNAFGAAESASQSAGHSQTLLVQAQAGTRNGLAGILVDSAPLKDGRDKVVFVYVNSKGHTVVIVYRAPPYQGPVAHSGFFSYVAFVDEASYGSAINSDAPIAIVEGSTLQEATRIAAHTIVLPKDKELAVGFGFPDGTFSNFVKVHLVRDPSFHPRKPWSGDTNSP